MAFYKSIDLFMEGVKRFTSGARIFLVGIFGEPILMILLLLISFFLAYRLEKISIIHPLSGKYLIKTLGITLLFFLILMYL